MVRRPDGPRSALAHQPRSLNRLPKGHFDLVLSGHTHLAVSSSTFTLLICATALYRSVSAQRHVGLRRRGTAHWGPPLRLGARGVTLLCGAVPGGAGGCHFCGATPLMKTPSCLAASLVTTLACSRPARSPLTDASGAPSGGVDAGAMTPGAGVTERCDDPGFVPLRRISRRAFRHALRDLLGASFGACRAQPGEDDIGHGFDHLGEVLSFTPVHLEQAEAVVDQAVADAAPCNAPLALKYCPPARASVGGPTEAGAGIFVGLLFELELFFEAGRWNLCHQHLRLRAASRGPDPADDPLPRQRGGSNL